jgi:hypothetical protein
MSDRSDASNVRLDQKPDDHIYLPLLQRLTMMSPSWCVWKNADRALSGHGDIDCSALADEWDSLVSEYRRWATQHSLGPVVACPHVKGVLFVLAIAPQEQSFYELDLHSQKYFRGGTLFRAEDLASPLTRMDERGFRRARPGVEGVIVFTQNGTRWGGRSNMGGSKTDVALQMIREDPEGARLAAEKFFGPANKALLSAVQSALGGEWNQRAALAVDGWSVLRALREPHVIFRRFRTRGIKKHCPVLLSIFRDDRRLPADIDAWLSEVASDHRVLVDS